MIGYENGKDSHCPCFLQPHLRLENISLPRSGGSQHLQANPERAKLILRHSLESGTRWQMGRTGFTCRQKCSLHTRKHGKRPVIFEHHKSSFLNSWTMFDRQRTFSLHHNSPFHHISPTHPCRGVINIDEINEIPPSLSVNLTLSRPNPPNLHYTAPIIHDPLSGLSGTHPPIDVLPHPSTNSPPNNDDSNLHMADNSVDPTPPLDSSETASVTSARPTKRRRVVPEGERKHPNVRTCRRCKEPDCPGSNDITKCLAVCTVACRTCKQFKGCRGVDNGRNCTFIRR